MTKTTIEDTYKKLTQREHVLHRSGMYIGDVKKHVEELWIFNGEKMEKRAINYSPGFMKIFDEVLTNATDHSFRDPTVSTIKVEFDKKTGEISVWNNGNGIPVVEHKEHKMYVPELIFGNLLSGSNYNDTNTRTGAGTNGLGSKCVLHTTPIPLYNGEIKIAKDIQIGDILIGDDGNTRTVISKIEGESEMYKIIQNYGDEYIVNNNHILTLHMPDHKVIFWNNNGWKMLWWNNDEKRIKSKFIKVFDKKEKCKECNLELSSSMKRHYKRQHTDKLFEKRPRQLPTYGDMKNPYVLEKYKEMEEFAKTIIQDSVFDIDIQDYMKLSKTTQRRLAGVRGQGVNWPEKDVVLDPYILGLWLGDGMKCGRQYACHGEKDPEIINYFKEWCKKNDANINYKGHYTYYLSSNSNFGKKGSSPLRNLLKEYNLIDNKHIPKDYLINSREIRLKVLAGLIDTDGYAVRDGTRIKISQSYVHKRLINDILYLARSLGFFCTLREYMASYILHNEKKQSKAYIINISGNIEEIPTLLPRKKCKNTKRQNTDKSTGYIRVEKHGIDKYVGFEIDGNKRFVINDFTVTHNCTNIFSKSFEVETVDSSEKKKFIQKWTENMSEKTTPKITASSVKSYTKITFTPDYKRFDMKGLENDTILLIQKRVLDCIACTNNNIQVYLNGERLKGKGLVDYTKYFFDDNKVFHESFSQKINGVEYIWEWAVAPNPNGFEQVSFVNGNATNQGGKHVDYILYQILNRLKKMLEEKKRLKDIKPNMIKDRLFLFLRATVANPSFNSQTKEQLTTQSKDFGCSPDVSEAFITKLYKSTITDDIVALYKIKEQMDLSKATDGTKKTRIFIDKLEDATWAGSNRSEECSLFVTEGLSASTFAKWGRNVIGNERFGVFPLKGKILNVRDASVQQLINNEEINNIKQILGLKQNVEYTKDSIKNLRYGSLIILTDADQDGSHISSLIINLFHYWWPSLLKLNYVKKMITPIIKVKDGRTQKEFYTHQDLEEFLKSNNNKSIKFSYYKGLGTWEKNECQELFRNGKFKELLKQYYYKDSDCDDHIKLAFEKEKTKGEQSWSDKRKEWLSTYNKSLYIPKEQMSISLKDMVNKELIHFSVYDNSRSIPNYIDGLKPSQRKILHYMLKRNITENIKVAQLSGYVSAETSYHHGEVSLQKAIVCMAQNFIGSNNINLLYPSGNFGTRPFGGADASSARYIFTRLERLTKVVFNEKDSELLTYIEDDGQTVEPEYFLPIIPMILVNGCEGIGTGYSTFIPSFSPKQIIDNLLYIIDKRGGVDDSSELTELVPYYKNFKGEIVKDEKVNTWKVYGKWQRINDKTILITELPVNVINYATFLQNKIKKDGIIKDYIDESTDENTNLSIKVEFSKKQDLDTLIENEEIWKEMKLVSSLSTNNMYVFDEQLKLNKYNDPNDLLLDFYDFRIDFYERRRLLIIKNLEYEHLIYSNKVRFIKEYISGQLDINRKSKDYVVKLLKDRKYDLVDNSYEYLYNMPIITLTLEKVEDLNRRVENLLKEIELYKNKTHLDLWREELIQLKNMI